MTTAHGWHWVDARGPVDGAPLIPLGGAGTFDSHVCFASRPITHDHTEHIYYFGGNGPHSGARNSSLGRATLREDGFAGVASGGEQPASFYTVPLDVTGKTLLVTADVQPGGQVTIGVAPGEASIGGVPPPEERLQVTRAIPVRGNVTRAAVRFERDADFGALVGSQVRLLAHLDRATVYAIGFR